MSNKNASNVIPLPTNGPIRPAGLRAVKADREVPPKLATEALRLLAAMYEHSTVTGAAPPDQTVTMQLLQKLTTR